MDNNNYNPYGQPVYPGQDAPQPQQPGEQTAAPQPQSYPQWQQGGWVQPQQTQPAENTSPYQPQPQPADNNSAPPPPQQAAPAPRPKRAGRVIASLALVVACGVAGFGGGYAALATSGVTAADTPETVVVYKAPETTTDTGTGGGTQGSTGEVSSTRLAVEKATPSVVSIDVELAASGFMGVAGSGAGSGVILSEDGYIITNHHVVEDATAIKVTLHDGEEYDATLVASDKNSDIAVIKIDATGLTPAVVGSSDNLQVGDFCIAVGNSAGVLGGTVTSGIISALDREITIDNQTMNLLQMSAAISPGNSGGGLFNEKGELVGIVNAKSGASNTEGLGFAIPVSTAVEVAADLIEHGYVTGRPALGVSVVQVTEQEARWYGFDQGGVYIQSTVSGGAADLAGLQPEDRIASLDGQEITSLADLSAALGDKQVGDTVTVEVVRDQETISTELILQELVPEKPQTVQNG